MSQNSSSSLHPSLNIGESLPTLDTESEGSHLFVSLSELILEHVFYHPTYSDSKEPLGETEAASINAILGDLDVETHFVSTLTNQILSAIKPNHAAVRVSLSGADSYSFSSLLGGKVELKETNPALGVRGVSRFAAQPFNHQFALECKVIKALQAQDYNVEVVVPFVRGLSDAAKIIDLLAEQGLPRGLNGFKVLYTVDVPAGALLSEKLLHYFDGVAINLENLAQFTLGIDRLSEELEYLFDPQSDAVIQLIEQVVKSAHSSNKPVVLCSNALEQYARIQETVAEYDNVDVVVTP